MSRYDGVSGLWVRLKRVNGANFDLRGKGSHPDLGLTLFATSCHSSYAQPLPTAAHRSQYTACQNSGEIYTN